MPPASLISWCDFDIARSEEELAELDRQAADPDLWNDADTARDLMQRLASVRERVEAWNTLQTRATDTVGMLELAIADEDESFAESAASEIRSLERELSRREFELRLSGHYDRRNAILAVHAGAGGTESQDWAEMLLRMYLRWGERRGFATEILDMSEGEEAGIKSATIELKGPFAYGYLRSERGVHRLVRQSPFDSSHSRHTSFAKVEVMPEVEETGEVELNPDDIRVDVYRASGHGGQNVQKNSTAIRLTHIPSGIVVTCQNERSQGRNRESAMKVLESRLLELELARQEEERAKIKGEHVEMAFGSQIRSYVLHPYKMVKDHRTSFETSDTTAVLDGDIDGFVESYLTAQVGDTE